MGLVAAKIEPTAKEEIVNGLTQSLAETAIATLKAQNFHWNVTGMSFGALHALFQEIYEDHFEGQDTLAERIKAFDAHAEGRYSVYLERSAIDEHDGRTDARTMVEVLMQDQETLSSTLRHWPRSPTSMAISPPTTWRPPASSSMTSSPGCCAPI